MGFVSVWYIALGDFEGIDRKVGRRKINNEIVKLLRRGMFSDLLLHIAADAIEELETDNTQLRKQLEEADLRVEADLRNEKLGYKIREAQLEKVPYMLIVGEKEEADGTVSVRSRKNGDMGSKAISEFLPEILTEIATKAR